MGIRLDTIRHWMTGRMTLRPDQIATLLSLVSDKKAELGKIEMEPRAWLAKQPREDSK